MGQAVALLRPVLRWASFAQASARGHEGWQTILARPVAPYLGEMLVLDLPSTMRYVTGSDLTQWGVSSDLAFAAARANVTHAATGLLEDIHPPGPDGELLAFADVDYTYICSAPLLPGWLQAVADQTGNLPMIFLPSRTEVYIALGFGPEEQEGLVDAFVTSYDNAEKPLSPAPYTMDRHGKLVPYFVSDEHPAWNAIRQAEARLAVDVYSQQAEALNGNGSDGEFATSLLAVRAPGGTVYTVTVLRGDKPVILIPEAHIVGVIDPATDGLLKIPWAKMTPELGANRIEGLNPPRYRFTFHEDSATIDHLRPMALDTWE